MTHAGLTSKYVKLFRTLLVGTVLLLAALRPLRGAATSLLDECLSDSRVCIGDSLSLRAVRNPAEIRFWRSRLSTKDARLRKPAVRDSRPASVVMIARE